MRHPYIIGFSGRKESGKNTVADFSLAYWGFRKDFCESSLWVNWNVIPEFLYDSVTIAFDSHRRRGAGFCNVVALADELKRACVQILGLSESAVNGSDDEKNAPTDYRWESAPSHIRWVCGNKTIRQLDGSLASFGALSTEDAARIIHTTNAFPEGHRTGLMSGRDIMQVFGTELMRNTFGPDVWLDATLRTIHRVSEEKPDTIHFISDVRFPNEVEGILREPNGHVIRLTRSPHGFSDKHPSEAALDSYNWEKDGCIVLDNGGMNIPQQNRALAKLYDIVFEAHSF